MAGKRSCQNLEYDGEHKTEKKMKPLLPSLASVVEALITENSLKSLSSALELLIRKVVSEEVDNGINKFKRLQSFSRSLSFRVEAPENPTPTLKLMFGKKLMQPIFTGSKITDVDNNPLEIILINASNNDHHKLDRPIRLDIVALHGDFPLRDHNWSGDEFERNIVKERDGKRPLLAGDVSVTVRNGVAVIGDVQFTDNSSWIRSRKFRIGVRVAKGSSGGQGVVVVCEAISEAFVVRDHRGELYKKHHPPMLEDEVWRLEKIGKDGAFHKKLSSHHINTVQDFLKLSVLDLHKLHQIMGMSDRVWEVTLKHARECVLGDKLYLSKGSNFILILNPICQVTKAIIDGQVLSTREALNQLCVKNLVRQAYSNWNLLEVVERRTNEPALLTNGDTLDQQYGVCFNITGSSSQDHTINF